MAILERKYWLQLYQGFKNPFAGRRMGAGRALALCLFVVLLGVRIWDPPLVEELRKRSFDLLQVLDTREPEHFPVIIVDVDEESLKAEGQWPWPRKTIAELIDKLNGLGAAAIGFDIIFAEPDRYSPQTITKLVPEIDQQTRAMIDRLPTNDELLAAAFRKGRVVVGESGVRQIGNQNPGVVKKTSIATIGADPLPFLVTFPALLRNIPVLDDAAVGQGLFTIRAERDGIVRRVPMIMRIGDEIVPSLSLAILHAVSPGPILVRTENDGIHTVGVRGLEVPTDRNGQVWVHFSPHQQLRYLSAEDVLSGKADAARVKDHLILIGTSAIGLLDRQTTPIDSTMPGVEIHAQLIENALGGNWISYPSYAIGIELLLATLCAGGIIFLVPILGALTVAILGTAAAIALVALSLFLYFYSGMLLDVTFTFGSTFSVFTVLVFTNYLREEAQRERIRAAFRQYLSPDLVEQLAQEPEKLKLGGEEREMTIMFSDVRGFTSISETYKKDPQGLTTLMNRLLTPLTNAIIEYKGTIDKYMGDAIMAFWNAPLDDKDHALNACRASLEMNKRMTQLNRERESEAVASGRPFIPIRIGVGINTGSCVVGNMGSDLRFDYSVLGDSVNFTSRIEGQTKTYGVSTIIGEHTFNKAGDHFACIQLDYIQVKGKSQPEIIYGILGDSEEAKTPEFAQLQNATKEMLDQYKSKNWDGALAVINKCGELKARFGLATFFALYASRISEYIETPPPAEWGGVYVATEK